MSETRRRNAQISMALPEDEESLLSSAKSEGITDAWTATRSGHKQSRKDPAKAVLIGLVMIVTSLLALVYWLFLHDSNGGHAVPIASPCDTVTSGYQCAPELSHSWGQYSPYYQVSSSIPRVRPPDCSITFTQLLSRHGARAPTTYKASVYNETISKIHAGAINLTGAYSFLKPYIYDLGSEDLTAFGEQELVNSGIDFFTRYEALTEASAPFIRAAGQERVVRSARKWTEGFHKAKVASGFNTDKDYPYPVLEIPEG